MCLLLGTALVVIPRLLQRHTLLPIALTARNDTLELSEEHKTVKEAATVTRHMRAVRHKKDSRVIKHVHQVNT